VSDVGTQVPCSHTGAGVTLIVPTATRLCPPGSAHAHRPLSRYPRPAKRILASHSASKSADLQRVLDASRTAIGYVIVPVALVLHPILVRCKIAPRRAGDTLREVGGEWCASNGDGPVRPGAARLTRICSRTRRPRLPCRVPNGCAECSEGSRLPAVGRSIRFGSPTPSLRAATPEAASARGAVRTGGRGGMAARCADAPRGWVALRSAEGSRDGPRPRVRRVESLPAARPWLGDTPSVSAVTASRAVLIGNPSSDVLGVTSVSFEFRPPESDTPEFQ
jgi:hypothetical protein